MWSVGCVVVEMMLGRPLFSCRTSGELFTAMVQVTAGPWRDTHLPPLRPRIAHCSAYAAAAAAQTLGPIPLHLFWRAKYAKKFLTDPSVVALPLGWQGNDGPLALRRAMEAMEAGGEVAQAAMAPGPTASRTARMNRISKLLRTRDADLISFVR